MLTKPDLEDGMIDALTHLAGEAALTRGTEHIWNMHETDLRASGKLFYTWQYDMRWAAQNRKGKGKLLKLSRTRRLP